MRSAFQNSFFDVSRQECLRVETHRLRLNKDSFLGDNRNANFLKQRFFSQPTRCESNPSEEGEEESSLVSQNHTVTKQNVFPACNRPPRSSGPHPGTSTYQDPSSYRVCCFVWGFLMCFILLGSCLVSSYPVKFPAPPNVLHLHLIIPPPGRLGTCPSSVSLPHHPHPGVSVSVVFLLFLLYRYFRYDSLFNDFAFLPADYWRPFA